MIFFYQITELKVNHNPFAKGFRDNYDRTLTPPNVIESNYYYPPVQTPPNYYVPNSVYDMTPPHNSSSSSNDDILTPPMTKRRRTAEDNYVATAYCGQYDYNQGYYH